ncbi:hypothetical protein FJ366_00345 [Candidatus Dependentiae bacterium]|nr:hypothetical protein [Candidatus Dependentiae bacterium]
MQKIVIIGAGLTGLSAAYHLEKSGITSYEIYEKQPTIGGLTRSVCENGFTVDYTGHFLHSNNEYFSTFLATLFGPAELQSITRNAHVFMHNRYLAYPFQTNLKNLPTNIIAQCIESFIKKPGNTYTPKTFKQWLLKAFGKGMCSEFFYPYNSKILQFPLSKIMPEQGGRFIPTIKLEDIIKNFSHQESSSLGYNSSFLYPRENGIALLPNRIESKLTSKIHCNHSVELINSKQKKIYFSNGSSTIYDILIATMPLDTLLKSTTFSSDSNLEIQSSNLYCNTVINLNLGINKPNFNDKHWIYFPEKKFSFYRIGFWNAISAHMAPKNKSSLFAEMSLMKPKKKDIDKKVISAKKELLTLLKLNQSDICFEKTLMLDHAYVIYNDWRKNNLSTLLTSLEKNNIFSIGRFGEWKYSSMQEAVLDGQKAAEKIYTQTTPSRTSMTPTITERNVP